MQELHRQLELAPVAVSCDAIHGWLAATPSSAA